MLFQPTQENVKEIIKAIREGQHSVHKVSCGSTDYMVVRRDDDTLYARETRGGKKGLVAKIIQSGELKCNSRSLKQSK